MPHFGDMPLDAIRQRDVAAVVARLTAHGLAPATVVKVYQLFAKVMTAAVATTCWPSRPAVACRCQGRAGGDALPQPGRDRLPGRGHPAAAPGAGVIGGYGGLRIGELAGLRRSRVDLDAGTVDVAENITEVQGKLHSGPPKPKASRRRVRLPGGVVEELAVHLRAPGGPTDYVFRSPAGGPLGSTGSGIASGCRRSWPRACRGCASTTLPHGGGAVDRRWGLAQGVAARAGHLFPESDAALRDRLDLLVRGATERRQNTAG